MRHKIGTLRFSEWNGLWKSDPSDSEVGKEDYEQVSSEFDKYFRTNFQDYPRFVTDFYVRGDFTEDRTQVLEIRNPRILTVEFLRQIQQWLLISNRMNWRVLIPTYLGDNEIIIIYPSAIRISEEYERLLEEGLKRISSRMRSYVT